MNRRPTSTIELLSSERDFLSAMNEIGFGRFECLRIERGELLLDPWPSTVRGIKFAAADTVPQEPTDFDFKLKGQVAEFFEYVRSVTSGEIRCLEIRHGLPFSMEIQHRPNTEARGL